MMATGIYGIQGAVVLRIVDTILGVIFGMIFALLFHKFIGTRFDIRKDSKTHCDI